MMRPIIVVGTGRSGTSTTARVLHQRLGVCMGHAFPPADLFNPLGYWEDVALERMTLGLAGGASGAAHRWLTGFAQSHKTCDADLRGYKHPKLCMAPPEAWGELDPLLVVRTWRPMDEALDSLRRRSEHVKRGLRDHTSRVRYLERREQGMDRGLADMPVVVIKYDRHLSDDEIVAILRPHIEILRS